MEDLPRARNVMAKAASGSKALVLLTVAQKARTVTAFDRSKALLRCPTLKHMTANAHNYSSEPWRMSHCLPADRGLRGPCLWRQQGVKPSDGAWGCLFPLPSPPHTSLASCGSNHTTGLGFPAFRNDLLSTRSAEAVLPWPPQAHLAIIKHLCLPATIPGSRQVRGPPRCPLQQCLMSSVSVWRQPMGRPICFPKADSEHLEDILRTGVILSLPVG